MPRETIYDISELFDIQVRWGRDTEVQVGISNHTGAPLADWFTGQILQSSPPQTGVSAADLAQLLPQFPSLWASLDRASINRLLRTLRKARDEAYGRDE